jgi:hypothetical protein
MTAVSVNRCCADLGTAPPLTMPCSATVCVINLVIVAAGIALVGDTPVRTLPAMRSRRRRIAGAVPARLPPLRRHAPSFGHRHWPALRLKPMIAVMGEDPSPSRSGIGVDEWGLAPDAIGDDACSGAGGNSRPHAYTRAGTVTARG